MSASRETLDEQSPLLPQTNSTFSPPQPQPEQTATQRPPTPLTTPMPTRTPSPSPPPPPAAVAAALAPVPASESTIPAPETPGPGRLPKVDSSAPLPWGAPAGLAPRGRRHDESLLIFRRAVGIIDSSSSSSSDDDDRGLEEGRKWGGVYRAVVRAQGRKRVRHVLLDGLLYGSHLAQVVVGAVLTALGPEAGRHAVLITVLGAVNTVVAGVLALVKGQGLPERLKKDEVEFRKLRDWIEETDALLAAGVVGRHRREVGYLVELAFKKYNAVKAGEENNRPESYVQQGVDAESRDSNWGK